MKSFFLLFFVEFESLLGSQTRHIRLETHILRPILWLRALRPTCTRISDLRITLLIILPTLPFIEHRHLQATAVFALHLSVYFNSTRRSTFLPPENHSFDRPASPNSELSLRCQLPLVNFAFIFPFQIFRTIDSISQYHFHISDQPNSSICLH